MTFKKIKLNIGSDFDGTMADHSLQKIKLAKNYNYELNIHQTYSDIMKQIIPEDIYRTIQKDIYGKLTLSSPMADFVKESLQELFELFGPVKVISRRRIYDNRNRKSC